LFVPPRAVKEYEAFGLVDLWERAESALRSADSLHVIGYRFPETDVAAHRLMDIASTRLKSSRDVVLVSNRSTVWPGFSERFPQATIFTGGFGNVVARMNG